MTAVPPGIGPLTCGCETTWLSSTIANWLVGGVWVASWPVTLEKASVPVPLNCSWTCQPAPVWVSMVAWALETSEPFTAAGPRASFS